MGMFIIDKYVCIGHNILSGTIAYPANGNEYYSGITVVDRYLQLLLL